MKRIHYLYLVVLGILVGYSGIFLHKYFSPAFNESLGPWDLRVSPFVILLLLACILCLGFFARHDWKDAFGNLGLNRNWWLVWGGLSLVAVVGIFLIVPAQPRIESNESILRSTAQNLHATWSAASCDEGLFDGTQLDCLSSSNTWQPKLPPVFYALGQQILPSHLHWAYALQLVVLVLVGLFAYLAVQAWSGNPFLALLTSVLHISQPLMAFHSRSLTPELWYLAGFWLVLLLWKIAETKSSRIHWALLGATMGLWSNTDNTSLLAILPISLFILLAPSLGISQEPRENRQYRYLYFPLTLLLFLWPLVINQILFLHTDPVWVGSFSIAKLFHGMGTVWRNMALAGVDSHGYLSTTYLSSVSWIAVLGILILFFRKGKLAMDSRFLGALVFCGFPFLWDLGRSIISADTSWMQLLTLTGFPLLCLMGAFAIQQFFAFTSTRDLTVVPSPMWGFGVGLLLLGLSFRYIDTYKSNQPFLRDSRTEEERMLQSWLDLHPQTSRLLIYSSPWFFVGQGQSALHYSRILNMDTSIFAQVIKRYQGEVYFVRGLDCRSSAQQEATASLCGSMEQTFFMQPIFQEQMDEKYQLSVQRVLGLLQFDPDSLVQIHKAAYHSQKNVVEIQYQLSQQVPQGWNIQVQVGDAKKVRPFAIGDYTDTLTVSSWEPGYHDIRILVYDLSGVLRASQVQSLFESQQGAFVPLNELPLLANQQSSRDLHWNTSVNKKTMRINGTSFGAGIGSRAFVTLEYNLAGKYSRFNAIWGHDDEAPDGDGLQFVVLGDGKLLWKSAPLHAPLACATKSCAKGCEKIEKVQTKAADTSDIDVTGIQRLTIRVDSLSNSIADHADIANPVLVRAVH